MSSEKKNVNEKMKIIQELNNTDLKNTLMKELDELEERILTVDASSEEAYQISLLALKKINEMLSL